MTGKCETCKYFMHEDIDDGFVCGNPDSEYVADWVEADHWCEEYEGDDDESEASNS